MKANFTILLVEDQEDDALLIKRALKKVGIHNSVEHVRNGEQAIHYLLGKKPFEDRAVHPYPEVILTDLKMPKMNGLELLKWLNDHPAFQVIPTMVMSSAADRREVKLCYSLGANAYFTKPQAFEALVELLATLHDFWSRAEIPDI